MWTVLSQDLYRQTRERILAYLTRSKTMQTDQDHSQEGKSDADLLRIRTHILVYMTIGDQVHD